VGCISGVSNPSKGEQAGGADRAEGPLFAASLSAEKGLNLSVSCSSELGELCRPVCNTLRAWGKMAMLYLLSLLRFVGQQYDSVVSLARGGGKLLHMRCELSNCVTAALVDSGASVSCISSKYLK